MTGGRPSRGSRVAGFGLLLAAALVLHVLERFIPTPFPFVRLGLSNVATLLVIFSLGACDAILIAVLRVTVGSLIAGTFLGPGFSFALVGGLAAAVAMAAFHRAASPPLGVVGVSLIGAAAHNIAQLAVLGALYTGAAPAMRLLPAGLLLAAATGLVTGYIAHLALGRLRLGPEALRPATAHNP
ncbi:MAG: heptaprenyl diphosphate synthase [Candidatus Eisenbacteria bacterium]|nr:heptaprenyl diphosphate synthase [Candidatus Eisenbacteria bacterium]